MVRTRISAAEGVYDLHGRCLNVRRRGPAPVLVLRAFTDGEQRSIEIVLR
jgi:hypothetical protein